MAFSEPGSGEEHSDTEGGAGTGLYAGFQTIPYKAPPIVNGRVPKNAYGNLDVYVPSMVPPGGVHLPYPEAGRAAKVLGIDYADAVTGFEFKGRHGTAVIKGIVSAVEYHEALEEVIRGFQDERAEAEEIRRSAEALRMWRRFMAGLRVRERIEGYDIEGERNAAHERMKDINEETDEYDGGGFLPDRDQQEVAEPTVGRFDFQRVHGQEDEEGGFMSEDAIEDVDMEEARTALQASYGPQKISGTATPFQIEDEGGGFMLDDNVHDGGGFFPDAAVENTDLTAHLKSNTDGIRAGSGLAEAEFAEAILLQRLYEEGDHVPTNDGEGGGFVIEQETGQSLRKAPDHGDTGINIIVEDTDQRAKADTDTVKMSSEAVAQTEKSDRDDNEEEDRGSLLSQDPEDEDADPGWLASDQE